MTAPHSRLRRWATAAAVVTGWTLIASGCAAAAGERDTITLVMADGFSPTHPVGKGGSQTFLAYVREHGPAAGLEIDYYGAGQLGAQPEMLNLVRTRAVDIGYVIPSYLANEVPLAGIGDLPGLADDPCAASAAILPTMQPGGFVYENELKTRNVQALWGGMISELEVITASTQITTPDDMRGLLIRSAGGISDRVIYGLGAAPVQLPSGDIYEAVARGTVAGLTTSPYVIRSYGLEDEIGYSTAGANLGATSFYLTINHEAWEELTEAQQAVLREASELAHQGTCDSLIEVNAAARGALEEADVVFAPVDDGNRAEWSSALEDIRDGWVRDLESVGIPAQAALDDLGRRLTGGDR